MKTWHWIAIAAVAAVFGAFVTRLILNKQFKAEVERALNAQTNPQ